MAEYTMTLETYLDRGGAIPQLFGTISFYGVSFSSLFIDKFNEREIIVNMDKELDERLQEFYYKLSFRGSVLIPFYKAKFTALTGIEEAPFKSKRKETNSSTGKTIEKNYDTPLGASTYADSSLSNAHTSELDNVGNVLEVEGVNGRANNIELMVTYQNEIKNLIDMLLNEFEGIFICLR